MNFLLLAAAFAAWGVVHSLLASLGCKDLLHRILGDELMRMYRLAYNIFSLVSLLPVAWLMWILPDRTLYRVPEPWAYLMLGGQGVAAGLLLYGVLQTDTLSFVGLRQLAGPEPRTGALVTGGLYRFVRHPLYSAGLLFLWLTPAMTVNALVVYVAATLYIFAGAYFEERKLLREYGAVYAAYRSVTPMVVPGLRLARRR